MWNDVRAPAARGLFVRASRLGTSPRSDRGPGSVRRTHSRARPLPESLLTPPLSRRTLHHERERIGAWQFATLGEGNHFLDLQRDPEDRVWITVHSGSRGIGGAISRHHTSSAPERDHGLPVFPLDSEAGQRFLLDQAWALRYAAESRSAMLQAAIGIVAAGAEPDFTPTIPPRGMKLARAAR